MAQRGNTAHLQILIDTAASGSSEANGQLVAHASERLLKLTRPLPTAEEFYARCPELVIRLSERIKNIECVRPHIELDDISTASKPADEVTSAEPTLSVGNSSERLLDSGLIHAEQVTRYYAIYRADDDLSFARCIVGAKNKECLPADLPTPVILCESRYLRPPSGFPMHFISQAFCIPHRWLLISTLVLHFDS